MAAMLSYLGVTSHDSRMLGIENRNMEGQIPLIPTFLGFSYALDEHTIEIDDETLLDSNLVYQPPVFPTHGCSTSGQTG
jgi:hypothetical protein